MGAGIAFAQSAPLPVWKAFKSESKPWRKRPRPRRSGRPLDLRPGFVDVAYTHNFNNPNSDLNQMHIFDTMPMPLCPTWPRLFERPADAGGSLLDRAGFRARLNFGLDSRVTRARSNYQVGPLTTNGFSRALCRVHRAVRKWFEDSIRKMNTLIGYEVINSFENPTFPVLYVRHGPGLHHHRSALYLHVQPVDRGVGVVNGWDNVDDNNAGRR